MDLELKPRHSRDMSWHWQGGLDFTVGIEEEIMLLDGEGQEMTAAVRSVLKALPERMRSRFAPETHPTAIEIVGAPNPVVGDAVAELVLLRGCLKGALSSLGLTGAAAGTHPFGLGPSEPTYDSGPRARDLHRSLGWLVCREPTFALHVHVGVADAERAVALMNRMRCHLPLLLALSANSPFIRGVDTGFSSIRTPIFDGFPRTGIPQACNSYGDWVRMIRPLVESGAIDDTSFIWWDVRLRPDLGTVEIRGMDSQSTPASTAALCALIQAVARLELEEGYTTRETSVAEEVLQENRFLAARDGLDALLITADSNRKRPVRRLIVELLSAARTHAEALGCAAQMSFVEKMLDGSGAGTQRRLAARYGLRAVPGELARLL